MVTLTPHSTHWPPAHPVPATSSRQRGGQPPNRGQPTSWCAGRPCACRAEGTDSVPRQCPRGHQLLPGLKGRAAAWDTQHPATGKCRGTSLCLDSAVPAARARHHMVEPEKLQGSFFSMAAAEDWQIGTSNSFKWLSTGVGAHPSDASLPLQKQGDTASR